MLRRCFLLVGLTVVFCLLFAQAAFAQFDDAPAVDSWVYESFRLVYDAGLIKGYPDGTFRGERPATRNEVVEFLARLMKYFEEKLAGVQAETQAAAKTAQDAAQAAEAAKGTATATPEKRYLSEEEVKALIQEELAAQEPGITQEDLDILSDDIYGAIQDLEEQFMEELEALDVRVTTLEEKVEALENKDKEHEDRIAKLQADLESATGTIQELQTDLDAVNKTLEGIQAQSAQDVAKAQEEAKKAKSVGYVGAALGVIGLLLALL
ncbi:MAG: S-layer homology domain-containing protein [Firmicutes bacterium]|nr:S-layer homology domain-containing protein [Bacillota bacterium]